MTKDNMKCDQFDYLRLWCKIVQNDVCMCACEPSYDSHFVDSLFCGEWRHLLKKDMSCLYFTQCNNKISLTVEVMWLTDLFSENCNWSYWPLINFDRMLDLAQRLVVPPSCCCCCCCCEYLHVAVLILIFFCYFSIQLCLFFCHMLSYKVQVVFSIYWHLIMDSLYCYLNPAWCLRCLDVFTLF